LYSLKPYHKKFKNELNQLKLILEELSQQPKSFKRDVFIQGTFLKVVINWENFIEECFLAGMCKCKTNSGTILRPKITLSKNKNEAFKKISAHRKSRGTDFLDWIDYQKIKTRAQNVFRHNSRFQKVYRDNIILNQIKAFRNHIAHNSAHSERNFQEQIIQNVGFLPIVNPEIADVLSAIKRNTTQKYFEIYIDYYIETADIICS